MEMQITPKELFAKIGRLQVENELLLRRVEELQKENLALGEEVKLPRARGYYPPGAVVETVPCVAPLTVGEGVAPLILGPQPTTGTVVATPGDDVEWTYTTTTGTNGKTSGGS